MTGDASIHTINRNGLQWLLAIWLCLLSGTLFSTVGESFRYLAVQHWVSFTDISQTLWRLFFLSLICCAIGFIAGPIVTAWGTTVGVSLLLTGLSEKHRQFVLCSAKNWFESDLTASSLALMFPASAAATYMLVWRFLLRRDPQPKHVGFLVVVSAAASQGMLWYFHYLEREVYRYGIC